MVESERLNKPEEAEHQVEALLQLERVDGAAVAELRRRVREAVQNRWAEYSKPHYSDIMDETSPHTAWRYLVHQELDLDAAVKLAVESLAWRRANHADDPLPLAMDEEIAKETWLWAPCNITGVTRTGSELFFMIGKHYRRPTANLKPHVKRLILRQMFGFDTRHARDFTKLFLVFDTSDTGLRNFDLELMSWLIGCRDYIPARIERIGVLGIPYLMRPIVRLIISWFPSMYSQLVHCGTLEQVVLPHVDTDQLPIDLEESTATDERYRLAPPEAPWMSESSAYTDPALVKAIEECAGWTLDEARRQKLEQMQRDHERRLHKSQNQK